MIKSKRLMRLEIDGLILFSPPKTPSRLAFVCCFACAERAQQQQRASLGAGKVQKLMHAVAAWATNLRATFIKKRTGAKILRLGRGGQRRSKMIYPPVSGGGSGGRDAADRRRAPAMSFLPKGSETSLRSLLLSLRCAKYIYVLGRIMICGPRPHPACTHPRRPR